MEQPIPFLDRAEGHCGIEEPLSATDEQIACLNPVYGKTILAIKAANPEDDAQAAASRGDFKLLRIDHAWGGPTLPGLHCWIDIPESQLHGSIFFSDAINGLDDVIWRAWTYDYVRRFNIAVVNNPTYPFRDLCSGVSSDTKSELTTRSAWLESTKDLTHDGTIASAARLGQLYEVQKLLADGGDVNAQDVFGYAALAWASLRGDTPLVQLLLNSGAVADGNCRSCTRNLNLAISAFSLEIVRLLVEHSADLNAASHTLPWNDFLDGVYLGGAPLNTSVRFGNAEIVKYLLSQGADPEGRGEPPAFYAIENGLNDLLLLLLDGGAKVSARDQTGLALVQVAAERYNHEAITMLMDKGAYKDARSSYEAALWRRAHRLRRADILHYLIAFGGNANLATHDERQKISLATAKSDLGDLTAVFEQLDSRWAALEADIKAGSLEAVKKRHAMGRGFVTNHAKSGLIVAIENRQVEIAKWYLAHGANPDIIVHSKNIDWIRRAVNPGVDSFRGSITPENRKRMSGYPSGVGVLKAFEYGPYDLLEEMLEKSNSDYQNDFNNYWLTPLRHAFFGFRKHQDVKIIDAALSYGGDIMPGTKKI